MLIQDTFELESRGTVVTGIINVKKITAGSDVVIYDRDGNFKGVCELVAIEMNRKLLQEAFLNDEVGLLLNTLHFETKPQVRDTIVF
ncbi:MAG: hypothetical protein J1F63_01435 [Oscillospiraceae bacterium]|nr:hypothetical protein [Oscillospiraceae bacterium]